MPYSVPLMRYAFIEEKATREELARFILEAPRLSMGEQCAEFEKQFAQYQDREYAVLFNSGGSANLALLQSLKNLGRVNNRDKVGFTAVTWSTNVMPIIQLGLTSVPVDCETDTLNAESVNLLEALESNDLKAFFLTNVLGFTGDLGHIRKICLERGVMLIEDNCESLGSELPQGRAGNFGVASTFSFFVAHHMSTIEGGMVCTSDSELDRMLRIVRANGWDRNLSKADQAELRRTHEVVDEFSASYTFYDLAYNLRPTEITGFLGQAQLKFLPESIERRIQNYKYLADAVSANSELHLPQPKYQTKLSSFAFPMLCREAKLRPKYLERLSQAGIECRPIIAGNIQRQPFYKKYVREQRDLPNADTIHTCGFYVGNYPELTQDDLAAIVACLT